MERDVLGNSTSRSDAAALSARGADLLAAGRPGEAAATLRQAISIAPRSAEAQWRLGLACERLDDLETAVSALRQALELKPSLAEARFVLATILERQGEAEASLLAYRKVRSSAGETNLGRRAEARACLLAGDDDGLCKVMRRVLVREPGDAAAWETLGYGLANLGRFEEAASAYSECLRLEPARLGVCYDLFRCRKVTAEDLPRVASLRTALQSPGVDPAEAAKGWLGLGKALDDLGDYSGGMAAFDAAEAARRRVAPFDLAGFEARVETQIAAYGPGDAGDGGIDDKTPIFVLGLPRSGTTLVEQILSAHPRVVGAGELTFWRRRGMDLETGGANAPHSAETASAAGDYLRLLRRLAPKSDRVIDKAPLNFVWVGLIHRALPQAKIIHCRRRPIDTALSIHQTWFDLRTPVPTGGSELVGWFHAYERLMDHWRRVLPENVFIEIDHEALTASPERETRRLLEALGLAFDPACLAPEANPRPVRTASKWQVRRAVAHRAPDRWRRYQPWLGPLAALAPDA